MPKKNNIIAPCKSDSTIRKKLPKYVRKMKVYLKRITNALYCTGNCLLQTAHKYSQFFLLEVLNELQNILMALTTMERFDLFQHFQPTMLPGFLLDNLQAHKKITCTQLTVCKMFRIHHQPTLASKNTSTTATCTSHH